MIMNFFTASVFLSGQLLAISPEFKSIWRSSQAVRSSRWVEDQATLAEIISRFDLWFKSLFRVASDTE
jgi:hypothetical protein